MDNTNFYRGFKYINEDFTPALKIWHNGLAIKADTWKSCTNFCTYCISKNTLIMLPDCSVKLVKDLRVGEKILGISQLKANRRKIIESTVEAITTHKKKVYQIEFDNGNKVMCSGEHLWLTERGWKFTRKQKAWVGKKIASVYPEIKMKYKGLTSNNKIRCISEKVTETPNECEDYKLGYLNGMIRGDGTMGVYIDKNRKGFIFKFCLRLIDKEALIRTKEYLNDFSVETSDYFRFEDGLGIRNSKKRDYFKIKKLIQWKDNLEFKRGFLAGAFDAEGSFSNSNLRIHNYNGSYLYDVTSSLESLDFKYKIEFHKNPKKKSIRLEGKQNAFVRFFQITNPSIFRKRNLINNKLFNKIKIKRIVDLGYLDYLYDIQTSTGNFIANGLVSHNCYARATSYGMQAAMGVMPDLKLGRGMNIKRVLSIFEDSYKNKGRNPYLEWAIRTKKYIELGTIGETFQEADQKYRISWNFLEITGKYQIPLYINTKGNLLCKNKEYFNQLVNYPAPVIICLTLTTTNDEIAKKIEPNAPLPSERLELITKLKDAGIPTVVYTSPYLKDITDNPLEEYMNKIMDAGAVGLHLRTFYLMAKGQQNPYWRKYYLKNKDYFHKCEWKKEYLISVVNKMKEIVGDNKFYIVGVKKRWFDAEPYHGKIAFDYLPKKFREPLLDFTLLPILRKIRQNKDKPQILTWKNLGYAPEKIDYPEFVKSQENGGFAHICTTCSCGKNFIKQYKIDGWKWVKAGLWGGFDLQIPSGDISKINGIYPVIKDGKFLYEAQQECVYAYIPKELEEKYVKNGKVDYNLTNDFITPKRAGGTDDKFYTIEELNRL